MPPPRPPCFFSGKVAKRDYKYMRDCIHELESMCVFFNTGGRAAPQTPCFFFSARSADENASILFHVAIGSMCLFLYTGEVPPPRPPCILFGTVGAQEYE